MNGVKISFVCELKRKTKHKPDGVIEDRAAFFIIIAGVVHHRMLSPACFNERAALQQVWLRQAKDSMLVPDGAKECVSLNGKGKRYGQENRMKTRVPLRGEEEEKKRMWLSCLFYKNMSLHTRSLAVLLYSKIYTAQKKSNKKTVT